MSTTGPGSAGSQNNARLPPVIGLIGTIVVCAAALLAHLSESQLKPLAIGLWLVGVGTQIVAFGMAWADRSVGRD
jgi:hypothetical protein